MRLFVSGQDRTDEIEKIYDQVIPVAQILEDRSIPINPAVCFIDADWTASIGVRDLLQKPYKHNRVVIQSPHDDWSRSSSGRDPLTGTQFNGSQRCSTAY